MDLFYTAEWMARQDQDHSLPMHKKLKLKPVEEDGTVFKMFDGDTEKAQIDLHDRNPGEVSRPVSASMETQSSSSTILKIRAASSCGETGRCWKPTAVGGWVTEFA